MNISELSASVLAGERKWIARAVSTIENHSEHTAELLRTLAPKIGRAYRIGITGPPGAGKSTLTNALTKLLRSKGKTVAVVAIDPTSPFTGGALLGDRIRMQDIAMDPGVFVRSMASRGSLGGLSATTKDAADILDAAGFDYILLETVGVGQSELDIAKAADTTIVVLVPESGDAVQAMKSGLMEIADFFVVNKADRQGADQAVQALKTILTFRVTHAEDEWIPEVIKTAANKSEGVEQVLVEIERHREYLSRMDRLQSRRLDRERDRVHELVEASLKNDFWSANRIQELELLLNRSEPPASHDIAEQLVMEFRSATKAGESSQN